MWDVLADYAKTGVYDPLLLLEVSVNQILKEIAMTSTIVIVIRAHGAHPNQTGST